MTLIPLEKDQKTISGRFRKAYTFAFLDQGEIFIEKNPHKKSKSPEFFEYFKTLNVDTLCIKELGYKTCLKLLDLGVDVYLIEDANTFDDIRLEKLLLLDKENAKAYCSLGHHKKAEGK